MDGSRTPEFIGLIPPYPEDEHPKGAPIYSPTMNSPGLQQRTRCSRSHRIGSLLLVHPLSSDETRVSPLQKGDNVPIILLLTKYPYGLSFLLWPYRDVHTFPMRYVTVLACEHSYPLHLNLESGPQATGHSGYPHKFPQQLDTLVIRTRFSDRRQKTKQLDTPAIRTRVPKQLDTPIIRTSASQYQATGQ